MAYTKYSLTPANNNAAPPDGAPEGMLPSAVNDTMRDMMAQIRDVGDGIRGGTYTMTAPVITGGSITGVALSGNTFTNPVITGGSINNTPIGATTASTGKFSTLTNAALTSGRVTYAGTSGVLQDDADFTFNGTTVTMANDASISGLTVGKGGGAVASATAVGNNAMLATNTGANNSAFGSSALRSNTSGTDNTAIGLNSMYYNTAGYSNTATGVSALQNNTTGDYNTGLGYQALLSNTTASDNTAIGSTVLQANTTGIRNTGVGGGDTAALLPTLYSNTTGSFNTGIGIAALGANTTASYNTAVGYQAAYGNTTGAYNAAFGQAAFNSNTTGNYNTALGAQSLASNTTATSNVAVGYQAGYGSNADCNIAIGSLYGGINAPLSGSNTGIYNIAIGSGALLANTSGGGSTVIGVNAGKSNTTATITSVGYQSGFSNTTGTFNSFFGQAAGYGTTTGSYNTYVGGEVNYNGGAGSNNVGVGHQALRFNTASNNTASGFQSLYTNTTGSENTAVGYRAGFAQTTGAQSAFFGYRAGDALTTGVWNTVIGAYGSTGITTGGYNVTIGDQSPIGSVFSITTQNDRGIFGHNNITNAYIKVAWTVTSDARDKTNINPIPHGLEFVKQLNPVSYNFKKSREDDTPHGNKRYGFLAQEILALEGEDNVIIDNEQDDHLKYQGEALVPVLVKAIQELNAKVEAQALEIATLKGK
jgi:hypothetical protein